MYTIFRIITLLKSYKYIPIYNYIVRVITIYSHFTHTYIKLVTIFSYLFQFRCITAYSDLLLYFQTYKFRFTFIYSQFTFIYLDLYLYVYSDLQLCHLICIYIFRFYIMITYDTHIEIYAYI